MGNYSHRHEVSWEVYLFFSDCSIDVLAMINTLSLFLIFFQIYTTREDIALVFGLQLRSFQEQQAEEDAFGVDYRNAMGKEVFPVMLPQQNTSSFTLMKNFTNYSVLSKSQNEGATDDVSYIRERMYSHIGFQTFM